MIEKKTKPWKKLSIHKGPDVPLFDIEIQKMESPRNQSILDAIVLKLPDTINVVALDEDGSLILVEQYRFGIHEALLELPAGFIDGDEEPLVAAKRELYEETGYLSDEWSYLGVTYLNPSYVNNRCYHFLAINATFQGGRELDSTEDIAIHHIRKVQIDSFLSQGGIQDAIGLAAISKVFDMRKV